AAFSDPAQRELLEYQCAELSEFAPEAGEFENLSAEFLRLNRVDELRADCAQALELLQDEDGGVKSLLGRALRLVESLASAEPRLADAHEALEQAAAALGDARHSLQSGEERFESDPERLTEISRRLDQWENLARKHRCAAADLAEHWQSLQLRLNQAENEDGERSRLQAAIAADQQQCAERAATLSQARSAAAAELAKQTLARLPALGLEHARLELALRSDPEQLGPEGQDSVHILVSLNPGQPLQPLAKVASGGELARISLALAVSCRARAEVPILLFDEVDVGVGGAIAEAIGEHLLALAADNQVLCVTHQPQVAALGRAHLLVRKEVRDGATYSQISPLSEDARVEELSRMAGGRAITEQTRAHARALLASRPALAK
ncbi:MAG: DNA repair protein RecN, partial [Oceanococcaceae bacterium]